MTALETACQDLRGAVVRMPRTLRTREDVEAYLEAACPYEWDERALQNAWKKAVSQYFVERQKLDEWNRACSTSRSR